MALQRRQRRQPVGHAPELLRRPEVLDLLRWQRHQAHPGASAAGYDKQVQFEAWLADSGYATIDLPRTGVRRLLRPQPRRRAALRAQRALRPPRDEPVRQSRHRWRQPRRRLALRRRARRGCRRPHQLDRAARPDAPDLVRLEVQGRDGLPGGLRRRQPGRPGQRRRHRARRRRRPGPRRRPELPRAEPQHGAPAGGWDDGNEDLTTAHDVGPSHGAGEPVQPVPAVHRQPHVPRDDPVHRAPGLRSTGTEQRTSSSSSTIAATRPRLHGPSRPAAAARGPASGTRRSSAPSA